MIENTNLLQRLGIAATVVGVVILLVVHNPTDGYVTTRTITIYPSGPAAPKPEKDIRDVKDHEEFNRIVEQYRAWTRSTSVQYVAEDIDFLDWESNGSFVPQVRRVKHALLVLLGVLLVGGAWIWLFRTPPAR